MTDVPMSDTYGQQGSGRHRHLWTVVGSEYTPPLEGLEVDGLRANTDAARRAVAAIERALQGFTTVTYRCGCRLQTTRVHRGRTVGPVD